MAAVGKRVRGLISSRELLEKQIRQQSNEEQKSKKFTTKVAHTLFKEQIRLVQTVWALEVELIIYCSRQTVLYSLGIRPARREFQFQKHVSLPEIN